LQALTDRLMGVHMFEALRKLGRLRF